MRRQTRYRTRAAIEKRIDRYHDKLGTLYYDLLDADAKISSFALTGTPNGEWRIRHLIDEKMRLEAKCERINRRLRRLKENLGEMLTPQLPALDNGDRSVAA